MRTVIINGKAIDKCMDCVHFFPSVRYGDGEMPPFCQRPGISEYTEKRYFDVATPVEIPEWCPLPNEEEPSEKDNGK